METGRISPQRTRNRGGITIRRPGNRAPQIFRLTSTLPPRLTSTTTTTPAPPPPTTTTNPPTTEEAFAQYSSTSPAITTRRLPSLRRRPLSSGAGSRGSSRDRLRQRLQSSRTSPNSLSSNRVQTTTSAAPSDFFTQSEAPFTTPTETTPTPSTAGRLVSRSTIGQARTSAPANLFQTIATTPATTTASRSFPFPSAGQQLNGDADSDDYDYYYDYFFEYPDGTVVEIPEDQLDDLQSEIAAAKKALLESERSTGSLREDRKIDTAAFISSTASPRFLNSVTTSSSLQNFEIPQGYEVTEYAVPIAGNRHEDVVIFEDETGQRVISTTYRPIVNKATETNKIEDSTLRQFLGEIEGTTKSTIVNRKNDASRPNDFRNDARSFSNFRKANRFDDGRIPANTFAKTNKPARGSFRQRTRAGSDRGQSTEEREGNKPVSSVPNLSIITRGQQGRIRTGSSIAPTEPSTDTISQTRTPFLNGRFVPTVEFLNALEQRRASTTTIRIPSPKTERTTTTTTTTTTEKPTPATFRPFRTPFQPIVRTTESPRSDATTENLDSITDVTRTSFFRQPSSRNTFRTDVGKARISSNGASGIEDRTTEALPVDQVIPNEAKTEVPSVVKQESTRGRNRFRGGFRSDRVRAAARNRQRPRTSSRPSTSSRRRNRVRGGTVVRIAGDRTGTKSADDRETVDQGVRERQTTTTATTTTTTTVTTTTTATTTTTTTTTTQVPIRSRVRGRNSRLLATRTRDRNANSRRRTVRKKAILRFIEPTTTSSPNIAEFEPAAVITTRSTVTRIPRINNPHDDMDEVEKEQFKKFLDDTDADLRRLNGQQLRDLFSQTIKKTAVFVRRKPGSAAPEIIGHGTVISQPGGERRVIVQNRPTSEITLIDSSTISSILRTTPAPRLRISPKPFSNERQALGTERTPLSLPRLSGSGRFFSSSDSNEPQQDLSVEGYSGVLTTESPQLNDVSNSFVSVDPFSHAPSRNNFFSNDEAHILPTRSTVSGNRADARTTNGAANEKKFFEQGPWRGVTSPTFDNADRQRLQATRQRQREPVDEVITASRAWLTGGENDPVENPGGSFLTQRSLITRTASPEDSRLAEEEDRLRLQRIATIVNDIKQDQASANKVEEPEPIKAPSGGRRTLIVHGQSNRKPHTTTFLAPRLNENNTSEAVASNNEGADGRDGETYGAIIDANDQVTCYGVGTFAHPSSSKKFIHCSSPRAGRVAGTVFLCPQGLQFDSRALTCSFVR